jgi:CO/xanthine dehydrogenase Mo-binding subunit
VVWEDGCAKPASSNVGDFKPLTLKEIAAKRAQTGGPIVAAAAVNPTTVAPGFATQFCDLEVDPETGKVTILRFVAAQDVGRAIHPSYVEGQIQGGVTQGIGWALNEEYIYDSRGHMENPGFLDYRIPVSSDLPMIEPIMIEVPNPGHPRQRCRRSQHLPADGGHRQLDRARRRHSIDRVTDVSAESTRRN